MSIVELPDVKSVISDALTMSGFAEMSDDDDFFAAGLGSHQLLRLVAQLQRRYPGAAVTIHDVYRHPTPAQLTEFLATRVGDTP
jgi:aryl carrier-like protein